MPDEKKDRKRPSWSPNQDVPPNMGNLQRYQRGLVNQAPAQERYNMGMSDIYDYLWKNYHNDLASAAKDPAYGQYVTQEYVNYLTALDAGPTSGLIVDLNLPPLPNQPANPDQPAGPGGNKWGPGEPPGWADNEPGGPRNLRDVNMAINKRGEYYWSGRGTDYGFGKGNFDEQGNVKNDSLNKWGQPAWEIGSYNNKRNSRQGGGYPSKLTAEQAQSMGDEVWYRWRLNNLWNKDPRGLHDWKPTPQDYRRRNDRLKGDNPLLSSENGGLMWTGQGWMGNPNYNNEDEEEEETTERTASYTGTSIYQDDYGNIYENGIPTGRNTGETAVTNGPTKPSYSYNDLINWRI